MTVVVITITQPKHPTLMPIIKKVEMSDDSAGGTTTERVAVDIAVTIQGKLVVVIGETAGELSDDSKLQFAHGLQLVTPKFPAKPALQNRHAACPVEFPVEEPGGHVLQVLWVLDRSLKVLTAQATHVPGVENLYPLGQIHDANDVLPETVVTV